MITSGDPAELDTPPAADRGAAPKRALAIPALLSLPPRRRRRLAAALVGTAALVAMVLALWHALSSTPSAPARETDARAASAGSEEPGKPVRELAAVLEILYRNGQPAPPPPPAAQAPPGEAAAATPLPPAPAEKIHVAQQRLIELGYLRGEPRVTWTGEALQALREFRATQGLGGEPVLDEATEQALYDPAQLESASFVGAWAPELAACSPKNRTRFLSAIVNHKGAWAGDVSCSFSEPRREGETWSFAAACSKGRTRWTSRVKLAVTGDTMTWTSERGVQRYVRCPSA